jgi:hypothetical protein
VEQYDFSAVQTFSGHRKPIAGAEHPWPPANDVPAMPRYFFHVFDGMMWSRDDEGDEFPDVAAAIQEAAHIARELLDDDEGPNKADFRMEVADEHGKIVHAIHSRDVADQ